MLRVLPGRRSPIQKQAAGLLSIFSRRQKDRKCCRCRSRPFKRNLPIILQRIESHLILKVITKRIVRERPAIPMFTIHDSIVTTSGNEGYVQAIITQEMEKAVSFGPRLQVERWVSENLHFGDGTSFIDRGKAAA